MLSKVIKTKVCSVYCVACGWTLFSPDKTKPAIKETLREHILFAHQDPAEAEALEKEESWTN